MSVNYGSKRIVTGAGYGFRDWLAQRVTGTLMALFTVILLAQVIFTAGPIGYEEWAGIFASQWMKVLTFSVILSLLYHVWVGMRDIWMDYVKPLAVRLVLHVFTLVWLAYEPLLKMLARGKGLINSDMTVVRAAWMRTMAGRENKFMDGQLLGHTLPHPILLAPVAYQRMAHPDGELATAVAAAALLSGAESVSAAGGRRAGTRSCRRLGERRGRGGGSGEAAAAGVASPTAACLSGVAV